MGKRVLLIAVFLIFLNGPLSFAGKGNLFLDSNVEHLEIVIEDTRYEKFPLFLEFQEGTYRIHVRDDLYQYQIITFHIPPSEITKIYLLDEMLDSAASREGFEIIALSREQGSLVILLEPFGTAVVLNGRTVGTTPLSIPEIAVGRHLLVLEKDGETTEVDLEIDPGTRLVLNGNTNDIKFSSENEGKDSLKELGILFARVGGASNPEKILGDPPEYPPGARKAGKEGQVVLQAVIEKDGTVGDVQILKSPDPAFGFEAAAIAAVKQWRYKPAMRRGEPVPVYFTIVVNFYLDR